jgi:hypothetical protein
MKLYRNIVSLNLAYRYCGDDHSLDHWPRDLMAAAGMPPGVLGIPPPRVPPPMHVNATVFLSRE